MESVSVTVYSCSTCYQSAMLVLMNATINFSYCLLHPLVYSTFFYYWSRSIVGRVDRLKSLLSINASSAVEWLNSYWISVSVFAYLWSGLFWCTTAVAVHLMDSYCCSVHLFYKVRIADNQCYVAHEQCFNRVVWTLCFMITNVNVGKTSSSSPSSSISTWECGERMSVNQRCTSTQDQLMTCIIWSKLIIDYLWRIGAHACWQLDELIKARPSWTINLNHVNRFREISIYCMLAILDIDQCCFHCAL